MTELFKGKLQPASSGNLMRQISSHLKSVPPTSGCHPMHMDFRIILKEGKKVSLQRAILGTTGHKDCPDCKQTLSRKTTSNSESVLLPKKHLWHDMLVREAGSWKGVDSAQGVCAAQRVSVKAERQLCQYT